MFLGNSYTYFNQMPNMFEELALAAGDSIHVESFTSGGYSLSQHLDNPASIQLITQGIWNFVILQEQSQMPTIPYYRDNYTFPSADSLNELIHLFNPCAKTVFFMTWGRKYGGQQCIGNHCSPVFVDYFHMQDSLESAYMHMALTHDAYCSPVGMSWSNSISNGDPIELYTSDASHPSLAGSYLIACTHYASIFNKSPLDNPYTGGLSTADARYLQQVAAYTVLTDPSQWNIYHPDPVEASYTFELTAFTADFFNNSQNAAGYYWDFGDPFSGAQNTSTLENPTHEYSYPGSYLVKLTAGYPCLQNDVFADTIIIVETGLPTYVDDKIIIFPNPAEDHIIIENIDRYALHSYRITGINSSHQLEGKLSNKQGQARITNLTALPPGVYILHLIGNNGQHSQKLIIR